jgi:hypothetical protein
MPFGRVTTVDAIELARPNQERKQAARPFVQEEKRDGSRNETKTGRRTADQKLKLKLSKKRLFSPGVKIKT